MLILAFAALAGALSFRLLTRRLRRLTHSVEEFGIRHLALPASNPAAVSASGAAPTGVAPTGDEIERLERVFGQMSGRLEAQVAALRDIDTQRREAVSNVSHDLRTPLAALQGYLETLLMKEGQLSPEEQRNYISTALKHSERLGKLIAALFELAKLDSPAIVWVRWCLFWLSRRWPAR